MVSWANINIVGSLLGRYGAVGQFRPYFQATTTTNRPKSDFDLIRTHSLSPIDSIRLIGQRDEITFFQYFLQKKLNIHIKPE